MSNFIKKTLACTLAVVICLSCMLGSLTFSAETINGSFVIEETYVTPGTETAEVKITVNAPGANELFMKVTTTAGEVIGVSSSDAVANLNSTSKTINISKGYDTLEGLSATDIVVSIRLNDCETIKGYTVTATLLSAASRYEDTYVISPAVAKLYVADEYVSGPEEPSFGGTYAPNSINSYAPTWETSNNDSLLNIPSVAIAEGGVGGSYALRYTEGTYKTFSKVAREGDGYFLPGETYRIGFKAKKIGTVSDFEFLIKSTTGSWADQTVIATEITDEWTYYYCDLSFDDFGLTKAGHKHWGISCTVGAGSYLYIDDIEIYNIKDPQKANFYTLGSFDTRKYNIVSYEPYTVEDYRLLETNKEGEVLYSNWERTNTVKDSDLITIAEGGVDDSYALKITGEGEAINREMALKIALNALEVSEKYTVTFKARVSDSNVLKQLRVGLMSRWNWNAKISTSLKPINDETYLSQVTTDWVTFTGTLTTDSTFRDSESGQEWHLIYINYQLAEGAVLYIDDISVKAEDGEELFWRGSFEKATMEYTQLDKDAENVLLHIKPSDTNHYNTIGGSVIAIDQAVSGENVLALGFGESDVSGRIWFETGYVRPRGTYKFEAWMLFVGDVTSAGIAISDNDSYANGTSVTDEMQAANPPESTSLFSFSGNTKTYLPRTWVKVEKIWTDTTTSNANYSWSGLNISANCPAGSGILIDSISITPINSGFEFAPNIFSDKGFEDDYALPSVEWSNKFTTNGDILDLSFMNDLPKTLGIMGGLSRAEYDQFLDVYDKNGDFAYSDLVILSSTTNEEILIFEAFEAVKNNKEIWLDATSITCLGEGGDGLRDDWKARLDKAAYTVQSIAGDSFQGIYFDEPCWHFANNEQFIEATKYIRENYKKRVFSMAQPGMVGYDDYHVNAQGKEYRVFVSAESHKYVTDFGVWRYSTGDALKTAAKLIEDAKKLDPNTRIWVCGLMGVYGNSTTQEQNIQIIDELVSTVKNEANFGGVLVWDAYSSKGYDLLKPDEATGVAEYDDFRHLLMAISDDLRARDSWVNNGGWISSDNVMVLNSPIMSNEFIESFNSLLQAKLTFYSAGSESSTPEQLVNNLDATILVTSLTTGTNVEYSFALANDVNCDNKVNAVDIVRAKRIALELVEGNKFSFAAAGSDSEVGITITDAAKIRTELMK